MSVYKIEDMSKIAHLYKGWEETVIWSCLQGHMGFAYADHLETPKSAAVYVCGFCFLAGEPSRELIENEKKIASKDFTLLVPENEQWNTVIEEAYDETLIKHTRFATKKEKDGFDRKNLEKIVSGLSPEYVLTSIDEELFHKTKTSPWAGDLVANFKNYEHFHKRGVSAVILKDGELVAGASTYSYYDSGIEIEINTREDYRRKGLALVCGAKIILECLDRGLYPSWDAHTEISLALAEKLGYRFSHEYPTYIAVYKK